MKDPFRRTRKVPMSMDMREVTYVVAHCTEFLHKMQTLHDTHLPPSPPCDERALFQCSKYEPIAIKDYSPSDFRRRYDYNQNLVVPWMCILYTYSGSRNHLHFVWKIPDDQTETELLQRNITIQQELKEYLPRYVPHSYYEERVHPQFW